MQRQHCDVLSSPQSKITPGNITFCITLVRLGGARRLGRMTEGVMKCLSNLKTLVSVEVITLAFL